MILELARYGRDPRLLETRSEFQRKLGSVTSRTCLTSLRTRFDQGCEEFSHLKDEGTLSMDLSVLFPLDICGL